MALMSLLQHHDSHDYGKAAAQAARAAKRLEKRRRRKEERDKQLGLWRECVLARCRLHGVLTPASRMCSAPPPLHNIAPPPLPSGPQAQRGG